MMAPPLAGSPRVQGHRDYVIKTLLHGMTGRSAARPTGQVMVPMGAQNDQWIANIASYVRNSFGNSASFITPADVARVRAATTARKTPWTVAELEGALPRLLPVDPTWKATASHNAEQAGKRLDARRMDERARRKQPGMWFQVELPQPAMITEVQFDAGAPGGRWRRRPWRPTAASAAQRAAARRRRGSGRRGERGAQPPQRCGASRHRRIAGGPPRRVWQLSARLPGAGVDGRKDAGATPVAEGKGSPTTTVATFRPVQANSSG